MSPMLYNWFVQKWNFAVDNNSEELIKHDVLTFGDFVDHSIMSLMRYRVQNKEPEFL